MNIRMELDIIGPQTHETKRDTVNALIRLTELVKMGVSGKVVVSDDTGGVVIRAVIGPSTGLRSFHDPDSNVDGFLLPPLRS